MIWLSRFNLHQAGAGSGPIENSTHRHPKWDAIPGALKIDISKPCTVSARGFEAGTDAQIETARGLPDMIIITPATDPTNPLDIEPFGELVNMLGPEGP